MKRNLFDLAGSGLIVMDGSYVYERITNDNFKETSTATNVFLKQEIYEWLLQYVGYEWSCILDVDRIYYSKADIPKRISPDYENWTKSTKVIPLDKRNWRLYLDGKIEFIDPGHASLFKLTWL